MTGIILHENESLFERIYPQYELDMTVEAILSLGIPMEEVGYFLEYAEPKKIKEVFEHAYPRYELDMSTDAILSIGIPLTRVAAFIEYAEPRKVKAIFENAYPLSEIGMSNAALLILNVSENRADDFRAYADKRRKAETRQLRLTVHNLPDATRLSVNFTTASSTPLSPTEEFTLENFKKEFPSAKEQKELNELYDSII